MVILSLAGAVIGWGWAWVGIRDTVRYYDPGSLALGRYIVASLVLLPFWWRRGLKFPQKRDWPVALVMGLLGFSVYNLCINIGEKTVTAGTASLIASCIPVMTTLGARYFYGEKLTWFGWTGISIAFAGVALTTWGAEGNFKLSIGAILVLIAAVSAAIYSLLNKRMLRIYKPLEVTTWAIWAGTLGLIPLGTGLPQALGRAPWGITVEVALLGIIPGAICYALFTFTISRLPMARVASWMFLVPLNSIILGWLLLSELPPAMALTGGAITLAGVYLVNSKGHPK